MGHSMAKKRSWLSTQSLIGPDLKCIKVTGRPSVDLGVQRLHAVLGLLSGLTVRAYLFNWKKRSLRVTGGKFRHI